MIKKRFDNTQSIFGKRKLVVRNERIAKHAEDFEDKIIKGEYDSDLRKGFIIDRALKLLTRYVDFDPEACDSRVPPRVPTGRLINDLKEAGLYNFNLAIASAQLEFIGVFKQGRENAAEYVGYAEDDKGSVAIPTELLQQQDELFTVTHNHPNCAAFSPADFLAFCNYTSIEVLYAVTVPYRYVFRRFNSLPISKEIQQGIIETVDKVTKNYTAAMLNTDEVPQAMKDAAEAGELDRYFSCTEDGAKFWSDVTHNAWITAFDIYSDKSFTYERVTRDGTAEGKFGTADVEDIQLLLNDLVRTKSRSNRPVDGVSDNVKSSNETEEVVEVVETEDPVSRHKAPHSDNEGYYSPAYDVSKSFGEEIYTLSFAKALQQYGDGLDADAEALQVLRSLHNKPDVKVKIYRAVEKGLRDQITDLKQDRKYIKQNGSVPPWADVPPNTADEYTEYVESQIDNLGSVDGASIQPSINVRDWVTLTKRYAEDHGELAIPNGFTVITKTVMAKDLFTDGNSIHEFGYDPKHEEETMSGISFDPPKAVQEEAARGLEWRREFNRGGTEVGVARARDLSNGRSVSLDTVKRMKAYFDRHQVDKNAEGFRLGEEGYPTAGRIAWALWGGDVGYHWAKSIVTKHGDGLGFIEPNNELSGKVEETQSQPEQKEVAPLTTKDVVNMEPPEALPLTGELKEFLSNLLAKFNMLIWGGAGSGKSSFVLRLANELAETDTGRVLYFMTEEKVASGRLKARMDLMKAYSENINFDDQGTFDRLTALVNTGMYRYVIVDSINMINVEQQRIVELMQTFPEVSWIFIAQATKGKNAYAGIQALAHAVDTEIATTNEKGTGMAELKKHRDGPLKSHTIFGNKGMRDPQWTKQW